MKVFTFSIGSDSNFSPWAECSTNLWLGNVPTGVLKYCWATSIVVSDAAQKYSGDSIHPIWRLVGTTSHTCPPYTCVKTYEKFHYTPNVQFKRQKPSLISHFSMNIFISSYACTNAWIIRMRECPHWSMPPWGAGFADDLLTDGKSLPFLYLA